MNTDYNNNTSNGANPVPDSPELAPRGHRLVAVLIDQAIMYVLLAPVIYLFFSKIVSWVIAESIEFAEKGGKNQAGFEAYLEEEMYKRIIDLYNEPLVWFSIFAVLIFLITQVVLRTLHGQTLGKKIMGLRIVNAATFEKVAFARIILLRTFCPYIIPVIFGYLPFLGPLLNLGMSLTNVLFIFREDRRCIHDLIAGTTVIKVRKD